MPNLLVLKETRRNGVKYWEGEHFGSLALQLFHQRAQVLKIRRGIARRL